jgi:hypothetical protein
MRNYAELASDRFTLFQLGFGLLFVASVMLSCDQKLMVAFGSDVEDAPINCTVPFSLAHGRPIHAGRPHIHTAFIPAQTSSDQIGLHPY